MGYRGIKERKKKEKKIEVVEEKKRAKSQNIKFKKKI
jgi:hypothetical protein